jgi:hypothetical protein
MQFNQDNDGILGALKLTMISSIQGREHIIAHVLDMDDVASWYRIKEQFNKDEHSQWQASDDIWCFPGLPQLSDFLKAWS